MKTWQVWLVIGLVVYPACFIWGFGGGIYATAALLVGVACGMVEGLKVR